MTQKLGSAISTRAMERLLKPKSVAIVGASPTPGALGASVIANLDRMAFKGEIHLINPKRDEIGGRPCLKSVDELPVGVDVAVLAIPRPSVLETIKSLANRQVGAAIIFSAGFAEDGKRGRAEQLELSDIATASGMVIEGPNCLGFVNYVAGTALTFVETPAIALGSRPGVGIVSQSGAMAAAVGVTLTAKGLGLSYSISTGNEAASGVEDYVEYLLRDESTHVIALIVEQFREPRRFLALARRARGLGKGIVLLHPGRSRAARESAATHTGAMAGDHQVMRTQVARQGVVLVETLEEFSDVLELRLRCGVAPPMGTAVVTESGAFKALTLDLCEQLGLPLLPLNDQTAPQLRDAIPDFVPVSNPVDVTAQGLVDPDLYRRTLEALAQDERFGIIVLGIIQTNVQTSNIKFPPILKAVQELKPRKVVIFAGVDDGAVIPAMFLDQLRALNVPYFPSPDRAFRAVARWRAAAEHGAGTADVTPLHLSEAMPLPRGVLAEFRAKQLLAPLGVPFSPGRLVKTLDEAQRVALEIGTSIVLKAQSSNLSHKSDAGGVILGLRDASSITEGWERLHENIARHRPGLVLDGVLVERMSERGVELIVGGRKDPEWGPIVLAGFGGVTAEILQDVRLLPADLSIEDIVRELYLLKSAALFRGFRGSPELDVPAAARIISLIGRLLITEPSIREIELNPVIIYPKGQGAIALDALLVTA